MSTSAQAKKALIIGGGMAGLLAARVLSEYYSEILIIDRDQWSEKPELRVGTPQAFHLHQLLPRGEALLEKLFPAYNDDLLALGAFPVQNTFVTMVNKYGTLMMPFDKGTTTCSRTLLEWVFRKRVRALANVRFVTQQEVIGLEKSPDGKSIAGVHIRQRGQQDQQSTLRADLIIDASGRSSKLASWLQALGYSLPESERVNAGIGYSSRYYKIPQLRNDNTSLLLIESNPEKKTHGAVLMTIENDVWSVAISGAGGNYPPVDAQEFDEELHHLISPLMAEKLKHAEPLNQPRGYRLTECVRQHYEQMEAWPQGLLVLGDSFCSFDPIYGQGITIATMEAEAIASCLQEQEGPLLPGSERSVLQKMQDAIHPAWWRNALEDMRWSGVIHSGPQPLKGAFFLQKYLDLYLKQVTAQMLQGNFHPIYGDYFMFNFFHVAPREVINAKTLAFLLETETASELKTYFTNLINEHGDHLDRFLEDIVPAFEHSFAKPTQAVELA